MLLVQESGILVFPFRTKVNMYYSLFRIVVYTCAVDNILKRYSIQNVTCHQRKERCSPVDGTREGFMKDTTLELCCGGRIFFQ